jgi:glutamyl-tRNA reductase
VGTDTSQLVVVGVCHGRTSLGELGEVSVHRDALPSALRSLTAKGSTETVVLSTCSRTEIYAASPDAYVHGVAALAEWSGRSVEEVSAVAGTRSGPEAVRHLFRVTAGLESRLVGDVDVVAQVRSAWRAARGAGTAGPLVERVFPAALRAAHRAQTDTRLGRQGRSLARRAVDVGVATAGGSTDRDVLVVGSGKMAGVACDRLTTIGRAFRVAARDESYAARLAGSARVCPMDAMPAALRRADLVICATSAQHPVVTLHDVIAAMDGRKRALTIVDLAVPPNVDPRVGHLDGVRLVDLTALGDDARQDPGVAAALVEAEAIVETAAQRLCADIAAQRAGRVIGAIRARVEQTCLEELRRRTGDTDPDALARAAHAVAGKMLHHPTMLARAAAATGDHGALGLLCQAFGVTPDAGPADRVLLGDPRRSRGDSNP